MTRTKLGRQRILASSVVVASMISVGCAGPQIVGSNGLLGRNPIVQECNSFNITEIPIEIKKQGGRVPLGGGNFLIVPQDAVEVTRTYNVEELGGDRIGVRLTPQDGMPTEFDLQVILLLSYNGCKTQEDEDDKDFFIVRIEDNTPIPIGGIDRKRKKYVAVPLTKFSEFAIAI